MLSEVLLPPNDLSPRSTRTAGAAQKLAAVGVVLLKTLLSLVYAIVVPTITDSATGVVNGKILQWLRGDNVTAKGA